MNFTALKQNLALVAVIVKTAFQLLYGVYRLSKLRRPIVTVLGSAYAQEKSQYYDQAYNFAKKCAEHKISIITGGGPGIMYAANCAAREHKVGDNNVITTLGIAVKGVDEHFTNKCSPLIWVDNFSIRKWLLVRYAKAIIIFPGGLGTYDELFEIVNELKHKRIPNVSLILIGVDFWKPMVDWLTAQAFAKGFIEQEYMVYFKVTDDIDEAFKTLAVTCNDELCQL